jgi:trans-2,3-dihydro-3-hydroxyanthranilate isomerase
VRVPFSLVDVFTPEPFAGNQLCVIPEPPAELDSAAMQMLAQEIGFSETTYVTAIRDDGYDVRIFTPIEELPFAGHPTLGTAFVLVGLGLAPPNLVQTCAAGDIPVVVDLDAETATMRQLPRPSVSPSPIARPSLRRPAFAWTSWVSSPSFPSAPGSRI